ncbi:MAG: tetratricopeptide repeat protein, partial [Candidatus Obscuribacterales bacterium]|nr:tetratricopeptide repeat protein [Candidatus Obscuribacterales bacterium]
VQTGQLEKAKKDYDTLIDYSGGPLVYKAYLSRGQFYESIKEYDEALKNYTRAYELSNEKLPVLKLRVALLDKTGKSDLNFDDLNEIIKLNPRDDDAYRARGEIYLKRGMFEKALSDFNRVIESSPEFALGAYEGRALVYEKLAKPALAARDRVSAKKIYDRPAEKPIYKIK